MRQTRLAVAAALVAALIALVLATGPAAAATVDHNATAPDKPRPDPASDVLGWENGYWHDDPITVTPEDGLNETELDAVVARSMARVEHIRQLEFEATPPVEVITRAELNERLAGDYANLTDADRLRHNVKYEALFMVGEDTDSVGVERANRAGSVQGFYDPGAEEIKLVSNNVSTPKVDEITLSQELFHALQDQRFDIGEYNQSTRELHNARDGIIEGDGNYVDLLYQRECDTGIWNGTCLRPESSGAPPGFDPHLGLYQIVFQPYSNGPDFVRTLRAEGGWDAVNDVYADPPASSEQVIHPEKYGTDEPTTVTVPDTSGETWNRLQFDPDRPTANYSAPFAQFGEGGLYVALQYPGFRSQGATQVIPLRSHLNQTADGLSEMEPYLYSHPATEGWDGDKLVPYVSESAGENETAYVYRLVWDSPEDAQQFRTRWVELMAANGAEPVNNRTDVYRVENGSYADAFYLTRDGDTVTIVNAPTLADLPAVYEAAPQVTPNGTATPGETTPGFGVVTAVAALVGAALLGVARRVAGG